LPERHLPLPGEKSVTVYRPTKHQIKNPWREVHPGSIWRMLPMTLMVGLLAAVYLVWRVTGTPVTVYVNGQPFELHLHRRTVAGALHRVGVEADETLYVDPEPETILQPGMVVTISAARPVVVRADGQVFTAAGPPADPRALAAGLGIPLELGDVIAVERAVPASRTGEAEAALPRQLAVRRLHRLTVSEVVEPGGAARQVDLDTAAATVGEALAEAGYELYESDRISPPLSTPLSADLAVTVERGTPVTVEADGQTWVSRTRQETVAGLLGEVGLALGGGDYVLPGPDSSLSPGLVVQVVRAEEMTLVEREAIPFDTIYIPDPDLEIDQQRIVQAGREGELWRQVRVRREDGREVSRVAAGEWVGLAPTPQIVGYGTQIVIRTVDSPYGELQYWRRLHVLATSYSPSTAGDKQPGDPRFGLSATGAEVVRGIVAVDPRVIGLGTPLYVPNYGLGTALDTGGAVKGLRIDLGYDDQNLTLWYDWVDVYLLLPIPPPDQIAWVLPE
jgi:uncharacterized protein YabE (DUF348 family)